MADRPCISALTRVFNALCCRFAVRSDFWDSSTMAKGDSAADTATAEETTVRDFIREIADRVIFMDGGVIVETGPPSQVIDAPEQDRTQSFLERVL